MSIKDAFNEDEWFLLSATPGMVGAAMCHAAPSGIIGTIKEMSAGMKASVQARLDHPDSDLISALLEKAENWDAAKERINDYRERSEQRMASSNVQSREQLQTLALEDCRAAAALVDARCSESESTIYKQWTANVARSVAEAAKEGSVLGFGGERVSADERVLLTQIESILGIKRGELLA